jgi:exonuclease III
VNSLSKRLELIIHKMQISNADILLLQEINTNINHHKFRSTLQGLTQFHPKNQYIFSSMSGNPNSIYLPGGTAIFVKHTLAQHITKRITDHMGRWCGIILKISRHSMAVLSISQPPKNQSCKGTVNTTTQQSR